MSDKMNPKIPILIGILLLAVSLFLNYFLSFLTENPYIMLSLYIRGFAMGLLFTPLTAISLLQIPREKMAQASGITNTIRQLGGSFGVAILATFLSSRVNYHSQMYNQAIQPKSQVYANTTARLTYQMEHNLGSSYPKALRQGQMAVVANINTQAYIQGIDDDFFIATLITIIGVFPVIFLVVKKKEKLKLKQSER
jgi:DHA2 family multidrug resistance protein